METPKTPTPEVSLEQKEKEQSPIQFVNQFLIVERVSKEMGTWQFGNFYKTAKEQGLMDADTQEFRKALNDAFKKIFVEQEEEKQIF